MKNRNLLKKELTIMALHPDFPESPHAIVDPSVRWLPDQTLLLGMDYGMLLPPLVQKVREQLKVHVAEEKLMSLEEGQKRRRRGIRSFQLTLILSSALKSVVLIKRSMK